MTSFLLNRNEKARTLGDGLRAMYAAVVRERVPDDMLKLVAELDRKTGSAR
jgi:hypothetical protein